MSLPSVCVVGRKEEVIIRQETEYWERVRVYSYEDGAYLEEFKPTHVVMFDANLSFIRQLEVYQAKHQEKTLELFFLMYSDSVEEQAYLASIKKEQVAFERMIHEKSIMAIPIAASGRDYIYEPPRLFTELTVDTRVAGGGLVSLEKPKVSPLLGWVYDKEGRL